MFDDIMYIDSFLDKYFHKIYTRDDNRKMTVEEFVNKYNNGTYLITMRGHITCSIDGVIYDTFYPKDRLVWEAYKV